MRLVIVFIFACLLMLTSFAQDCTTDACSNALILSDVHDPAQLVRSDNLLLLYASAIEWSAYDLERSEWDFIGDDLYENSPPKWDRGDEQFWAPSLLQIESGFFALYHSAVFDEDNHGSMIGYAFGDGTGTDITWSATGDPVIISDSMSEPFAIDPAVFFDDDDRLWLVYGSHAAGIVIVELNPETGLLMERSDDNQWSAGDERFTIIANYGGNRYDENNIEAAYIYNHPDNNYYYLFVNWDKCCSGIDSTYNIRVGRSTSPGGPFFDKNGSDMVNGGGTLFLDRSGDILDDPRFIGPGHAGIYRHSDSLDYFSHHFYDGVNNGAPSWALWQLDWIDGFPQIDTSHKVDLRP